MRRGTLFAVASALAFGITTPGVARLSAGVSPVATAALLYAGAAVIGGASRLARGAREPGLARSDAKRLVGIALLGAVLAPTLLAFGLARTGAVVGSLVLCLEAVSAVVFARLLYAEAASSRMVLALTVMTVAGALLGLSGASGGGRASVVGLGALALATVAWGAESAFTRAFAERDPFVVVGAKAGLGATASAALAWGSGATWPGAAAGLGLVVCGALGYGVSLALYVKAQRLVGAGRTASVFALAPFVGALAGLAVDPRPVGTAVVVSGLLFGVGVYLHATERHAHRHVHPAETHKHPHRHDDGHHDHPHDAPVAGEHAHAHTHTRLEHAHEHEADVHHAHEHG